MVAEMSLLPDDCTLESFALRSQASEAVIAPGTLKFVHELADSTAAIAEQAWYEGPTGCHPSVVKSFRPGFLGAHMPLTPFLREVKKLTGLQHRNLVPVLGVGSYDTHSWRAIADSLYVVEEYGGPGNLAKLIRDRLAPSGDSRFGYTYTDLLRWMIQVADAVAYLHRQGVAHGDVSCRNVFLTLPDVHKANAKLGDLKPHRATYALDLRCPHLHTQPQLQATSDSTTFSIKAAGMTPRTSTSYDSFVSHADDLHASKHMAAAACEARDAASPGDQDAGCTQHKGQHSTVKAGASTRTATQLMMELQPLLDQAAVVPEAASPASPLPHRRRCPRFSYSLGSGATLLLFPPQLQSLSEPVLSPVLDLPSLTTRAVPSVQTPLELALGYKPAQSLFQPSGSSSLTGDSPCAGSSPTQSSCSTFQQEGESPGKTTAGPVGAGHRMAAARRRHHHHQHPRTSPDIQWQAPGSCSLLNPGHSQLKQQRRQQRPLTGWPLATPPATPASLQSTAGGAAGRWGTSSSFRRNASGVWEEGGASTPGASQQDLTGGALGSSPRSSGPATPSSSVWTNFLMSGHTAARLAAEHPRILHMSKVQQEPPQATPALQHTSLQELPRPAAAQPALRRTLSLPRQVDVDDLEPPTKSDLLKQAAHLNGALTAQSSLDKPTLTSWASTTSTALTATRSTTLPSRAASVRLPSLTKQPARRAQGSSSSSGSQLGVRSALKTSPSWRDANSLSQPHKKSVSFAYQAASNRLPTSALPCLTAPPEALTQGPAAMCTATADVYSFGWVLYQGLMRTVLVPEGTTDQQQWEWIREQVSQAAQGELPRLPALMPAELVEVVDQCWLREPAARPSMQEVVDRLRELQQDPGFMGELWEANKMLKAQIAEEAQQQRCCEARDAYPADGKARSGCYGACDEDGMTQPGCGPCRIS